MELYENAFLSVLMYEVSYHFYEVYINIDFDFLLMAVEIIILRKREFFKCFQVHVMKTLNPIL